MQGILSRGYYPGGIVRGVIVQGGYCPGDVVRGIMSVGLLSGGYSPRTHIQMTFSSLVCICATELILCRFIHL